MDIMAHVCSMELHLWATQDTEIHKFLTCNKRSNHSAYTVTENKETYIKTVLKDCNRESALEAI